MSKIFYRLFKKYNNQQLPPKEKDLIDSWYRDTGHAADSAPNEEQAQREVWTTLLTNISPQPQVRKLHSWSWVAAVALAVGLGTTIYFISIDRPKPLDLASIQPADQKVIFQYDDRQQIINDQKEFQALTNQQEADSISLIAPKGSSFDLTLPDGTIVYLNSDSKLSYSKNFNGNERRVKLEGEGYFEVAHNANKPFIVHTSDADITVLGTKFNVRAYPQTMDNAISLIEGSVQLHNQFAKTYLKPGEMAGIQKESKSIPILPIGDEDPLAWKEGYFNFNNKPISELSEELGRWYNVSFDLTQLNKDIRFHGRISRKQSLKLILEQLSSTDEIKFEIRDQQIVIKNN